MDERLSILQVDWEVGLHEAPEVCFREFDAYRAPRFFGGNESVMIMHQITEVESSFCANFFPVKAKVRFVTSLLHEKFRYWWCEVFQNLEQGVVESIILEDFFTRFKREFVPCQFLDVSYVVGRVTTSGFVVRRSQGYVSLVVSQAMLRPIVL